MNWLFLRGLTREQRHWGRFKLIFERDFHGTQVYCLDLPGTGTEVSRDSPSSINAIVDDLRNRWLALRAATEGEWGLMSISLGSMCGMNWVSRFENDFSRIVTINTSAANLSHLFKRLRPEMLGGVLKSGLLDRDPLLKERNILSMTTNHSDEMIYELSHEWANYAREAPVAKSTAVNQVIAAVTFVAPPKIQIPLLVLSSAKDRFTHPDCSQAIARHFHAPIAVHEAAGHDLPLEDSEWVVREVKKWMGKL
jgi:pimeloyl-ACP methyl ester carboxylesterase